MDTGTTRRDFLFTTGAIALESAACAASKPDFTLRIASISADLAPGKSIRTVAYNGTVPGPVLRMKEGKPVTIDIFNDTDVPELVHWHGQTIPAKADGAEEEGSPFVPAHGHLRVAFTPKPAGTRWYHTHVMAMTDLARGAYSGQFGFLLVEPKSEHRALRSRDLPRRPALGSGDSASRRAEQRLDRRL